MTAHGRGWRSWARRGRVPISPLSVPGWRAPVRPAGPLRGWRSFQDPWHVAAAAQGRGEESLVRDGQCYVMLALLQGAEAEVRQPAREPSKDLGGPRPSSHRRPLHAAHAGFMETERRTHNRCSAGGAAYPRRGPRAFRAKARVPPGMANASRCPRLCSATGASPPTHKISPRASQQQLVTVPTCFTRNLDTDIPPSEEAMEAARAALLSTVSPARVRGDSTAKAAAECRPAWQLQAGVLPCA
jgi:hypothetical protein